MTLERSDLGAGIWSTFTQGDVLNMRADPRVFEGRHQKSSGLLKRFLRFLPDVLSSPTGDMVAWESGARGV